MKLNETLKLLHGDCLDLLAKVPAGSVDMILCDLPYGVTHNAWDKVIPFEPLWEQYERIITDKGAIVLFALPPFDKKLACSNLKLFRYEWIWEKSKAVNFLNANRAPLRKHELILVFSKGVTIATKKGNNMHYFPQKTKGTPYKKTGVYTGSNYGKMTDKKTTVENKGDRYPVDILQFKSVQRTLHPTQKPVVLCEYLIKTYTTENMLVLDNCMGSGTTGVACVNTGRRFIGMELDSNYFNIAQQRIESALAEKQQELCSEQKGVVNA